MEDGDVASRLHALFAGSDRGHGTHGVPVQEPGGTKWTIRGTAVTKPGPATLELWGAHLRGEAPLGVIPIRGDGLCLWGSIDVDEYDLNPLQIIAKVESAGLPLVPCRSKSGGVHLFMFLQEWTAAEIVHPLLKHLSAQLGLADRTEIFPKQMRLLNDQDMGNWIIMPGGPDFGGKLRPQVGLKKTGAEMTMLEFLRAAEGARVSPERLGQLRATRVRGAAGPGVPVGAPGSPFGDGPPCLQHLVTEKLLADGRKRALFHMAIYYQRSQPDTWREATERANQEFMEPPLPSEDVGALIRSLSKKSYNYKCRESPMKDHCDSLTCRQRRFGVGDGQTFPTISGLSKYDTDPPLWYVDVPGGRVEVTTERLMTYAMFNMTCASKLTKSYGAVKQGDWLAMISEAMDNAQIIEAGPEVGLPGKFRHMLGEFLTNRAAGQRMEDLVSGRPWLDETGEIITGAEPRYWFQLEGLEQYLARMQAPKEMTRGWVTARIKDLGGGRRKHTFKGNVHRAIWWVPATAIDPAPELELPRSRGVPI